MTTGTEWAELEHLTGVDRATHERWDVEFALIRQYRELGKTLKTEQHTARNLLQRPGETNGEWFQRHRVMSAEEQALVELVEHTRRVRADANKALRDLRAGNWLAPVYREVQAIVQPVLDQQQAKRMVRS